MQKKRLVICAGLVIIIIVSAYFLSNSILADHPVDKLPSIDSGFVGISLHSLSMIDAREVNESGAGWIRLDASDALSDFNASVRNAKAYNLSVLCILDSWMFNKSSTFTLEEWRSNVTYYVSQYADYVDAWEIWNEPANPTYPLLDLNVTNEDSQQNMQTIVNFYYSMAQAASPIIRQYDPTAKIVLFGGLNLWSGNDPHLAFDKDFASQLAAKNIAQYGDAMSVHAYPWTQKVESSIWQKYTDSLTYYKELYPTLEVWLTETGHPANFDGEAGQAQYIVDTLGYFQGKVTHLFWYSLTDNSWEENGFGLINHDGTARLAYQELKKLTNSPKL